MIASLITSHKGQVTDIRTDDAYRFVTVTFADHEDRQAFIMDLPRGTSWERGRNITVVLDLLLSEAFEVPAEEAPRRSTLSPMVRNICTTEVPFARGTKECGARAIATWDTVIGGMFFEEGACEAHDKVSA